MSDELGAQKQKPTHGSFYVVDTFESLASVLTTFDLNRFSQVKFPVVVIFTEYTTMIVPKEKMYGVTELLRERDKAINAME